MPDAVRKAEAVKNQTPPGTARARHGGRVFDVVHKPSNHRSEIRSFPITIQESLGEADISAQHAATEKARTPNAHTSGRGNP